MPLAGSDRGARSNAHFRHAERHLREGARFGKAMAHFERAMAYGTGPSTSNIPKLARLSNGGPYAFEWTYDDPRRKAEILVKRASDQDQDHYQVAHIALDLVMQTGGVWIFVSSVDWLHDTRDVQKRYIARAVASLVLFVQHNTAGMTIGRETRIDTTFDATWGLDTTSVWEITEPKKKPLLQRLVSNANKENEGGNIGRAVLDNSVAAVADMLDRLRTMKNTGYNRLDYIQSNRHTPTATYTYYTNGGRLIYGVSAKDRKSVHVTVIEPEPTGVSGARKADATITLDVSTKHANQGKLFVSDKSFTFSDSTEGSTKAYIRLAVASLLSHLHPGLVVGPFDTSADAADARAQWTHQPYTKDSKQATALQRLR